MSIIFRSRPNAKNLDTYLEQWKSCKDNSSYNADWAYKGFLDAEQYVKQFDNNFDELNKINDYQWLAEYFKECHGTPNKN
jgi:Sec7-like guanine-nucleotide exchange factor